MALETNPQLELAFDYVRYTNKNIFLTGKAGTGKTTFLHRIKAELSKRMAVVAPTGVAAINAGGVTIHSLFQLPFGPFLPENQDPTRQRKFTREKIRLIQSLDLLVIDEISMVRADLLDGIDDVLRRYKDHFKPFGGIQLLMIGDLHQLPPVVKDDEWNLLRAHYDTAYFFGSKALRQTQPVAIELKHIYRQADATFIDLLNKVRDNKIDEQVLTTLNSRYIPDFQPLDSDPYITLSSHNASAQEINQTKLLSIYGDIHTFEARIEGDFPPFSYPTEQSLEFKIDAQVMFVKNDSSREKLFYNGKIGKITKIEDDLIYVKCPTDTNEIAVSKAEWKNVKYALNENTKEVEEDIIGSFVQFPLKLAWAITIHKSQGLTFERAIIDANAAFAHGQVYVALSRCKSFEGIVLKSKIATSSVKTDTVVKNYSENVDRNAPDAANLRQSKIEFQQNLIHELFDFRTIKKNGEYLNRLLLENENIVNKDAIRAFQTIKLAAETEIYTLGEKFMPQIQGYFMLQNMPEENEALLARLQKAGEYFEDKLTNTFFNQVKNIGIISDNKAVEKSINEAMDSLLKTIFIKNACFAVAKKGFSTNDYVRAKANGELDYVAQKVATRENTKVFTPTDIKYPALYVRLRNWRDNTAAENDAEQYMILPSRALMDLVEYLPTSLAELASIKGIGVVKVRQFGADIVKIITQFCEEQGIVKAQLSIADPKPEKKLSKTDTKKVSLDFYKEGKTIEDIATERSLTVKTIEDHLAHFIPTGEFDIFSYIDKKDVDTLEEFYKKAESQSSTEAKVFFGEQYSYNQIKMVLTYLKTLNQA